MMSLWCFLSISISIGVQASLYEIDSSFTSSSELQHQIDSGIKFMCRNQYESNGQFLYIFETHDDSITIPEDENNLVRQADGAYALGLYYKLYQTHSQTTFTTEFKLNDCINSILTYLSTKSYHIKFPDDPKLYNAELVDTCTGATAFAVMALVEICSSNDKDSICHQWTEQFLKWIKGLLIMRYYKIKSDDYKIKQGAFPRALYDINGSSDYYDAESYLAICRLVKYQKYLYHVIPKDDKLWELMLEIVEGLDKYFIDYPRQDDAHWLLQAWFDRWVTFNMDSKHGNVIASHYIVDSLMKTKLETFYSDFIHASMLLEGSVDVLHAVQFMINNSTYILDEGELYNFRNVVYVGITVNYEETKNSQLFEDKVDFYYEEKYDGAFAKQHKKVRVDETGHSVVGLMKLHQYLFKNLPHDSYPYLLNNKEDEEEGLSGLAKKVWNMTHNKAYDLVVIAIVLFNLLFFFSCCYRNEARAERMADAQSPGGRSSANGGERRGEISSNALYYLGQAMPASDLEDIDNDQPWSNREETEPDDNPLHVLHREFAEAEYDQLIEHNK